TGALDLPTRRALAKFAGEFNLEARLRDDDQLSETLIRDLRDLTSEVRELPPVQEVPHRLVDEVPSLVRGEGEQGRRYRDEDDQPDEALQALPHGRAGGRDTKVRVSRPCTRRGCRGFVGDRCVRDRPRAPALLIGF